MVENNNLRKCSRCKCTILVHNFSKNRKGELFKCCDNCKNNKKHRTKANEITRDDDDEFINKARSDFLKVVLDQFNGKLIYKGVVNPDDIEFPDSSFLKPKGDEILIEYHEFEFVDAKTTYIHRWRLRRESSISHPLHIMTGPSQLY